MKERVFPQATIITPNLLEAEVLLGRSLRTPADVEAGAASLLASSGAGGVLIKGGHSEDNEEAEEAEARSAEGGAANDDGGREGSPRCRSATTPTGPGARCPRRWRRA